MVAVIVIAAVIYWCRCYHHDYYLFILYIDRRWK